MDKINFDKLDLHANINPMQDMMDTIQRQQATSARVVEEARRVKEEEELRKHNELIAAIKEGNASITIGDNAQGIQIQQNSAGAYQSMTNTKGFDYEQVSKVLDDISSYFDFPQFKETYGDNSENVKSLIESTIEAVHKHDDEELIKKSLGTLKKLTIGASGSIIGTGILTLLSKIPF